MAFNKVILLGNMVADPELKTTPSGVSVTRFRIAVNRRFAKNGETDFFDIVAWRQTAEFVNRFFSKGKQILVSGSLQNRTWTDNNGDKHWATEIVADEVSFVDRKTEHDNDTELPTYGNTNTNSFEDLSADDELPF